MLLFFVDTSVKVCYDTSVISYEAILCGGGIGEMEHWDITNAPSLHSLSPCLCASVFFVNFLEEKNDD